MTNQLVDGSHVTWFRVSVVNTHTCGWAAQPSSPASFNQQPRVCSAIAVHHVALRRSEGDASLRLQSCRNMTSFSVGVALVTLLLI